MLSEGACEAPHTDDGDEYREEDNDLEHEQEGAEEHIRRNSEGQDADLTEIAAPSPIDRNHTRSDSLEKEEIEARQAQTDEPEGEEEEGLTEIAAPVPVERRRSRPIGDEEKAHNADSSKDQELEQNVKRKDPGHSRAATQLYIHSYMVFFSILGTLARLGIEAITAYPKAPFLSPVLWANIGGSYLIGFLIEDRQIFREEWGLHLEEWSFHASKSNDDDEEQAKNVYAAHGKVKKTIPLFIGLTVGFCGSFTSFSSFVRDGLLAAINQLSGKGAGTNSSAISNSHRNGGYGFEAMMAVLIIQIAVSIAALNVGAHTASALDHWMPTLPFSVVRRLFDPFMVVAGFGCWTGAILVSVWPPVNAWRGQVTFALVFAPLGCLLRFHVSKYLNTRLPSLPLGTFCVNVCGTAILGMSYTLQHSHAGETVTSCQVLVGIMEGLCGCLTTVSTFVLELDTLRAKHAYIYGLTSVSVAMAFLIVTIGTLEWTNGLATPACSG